MRPLLLYIHGFISSSQSEKAVAVANIIKQRFPEIDYLAPSFSNYPGEAFDSIKQIIETERANGRERIGLIGSSLGGFMATMAAEIYHLKAVLINPAVMPSKLMPQFLGANTNLHTGECFVLNQGHLDDLLQIEQSTISYPENYWVMLQTGDETLDYRLATAFYAKSPQTIEQGGNHRFENFEQHLPDALKFLNLVN